MKENELRVGSIITIDNAKRHKGIKGIPMRVNSIKEILSHTLEIYYSVCAKYLVVNSIYETSEYCQKIENIKPIRLTEDWLLKFGFEKKQIFYYKDKVSVKIWDVHKELEFIVFLKDSHINNVEYVHQLQNLFFALTNEELTFIE